MGSRIGNRVVAVQVEMLEKRAMLSVATSAVPPPVLPTHAASTAASDPAGSRIQFPPTAMTSKDSASPYATVLNAFYNPSNVGKPSDLRGQCTWYAYGRAVELTSEGYLAPSAATLMRSAFWGKIGCDAQHWPEFLPGHWTATSSKNQLPFSQRRPGMLVVWGHGKSLGHVAFVEEISADGKWFRISDFNRVKPKTYGSKWYDFADGLTPLRGSNTPWFYQLPLTMPTVPPSPPVVAVAPKIGSINPNPVPGMNAPQAFTILGDNFAAGATVTLHDLTAGEVFANRRISAFSSTRITINSNFTSAAHTWSVEVDNPGGLSSNQFQFHVILPPPPKAPAPAILGVSPDPVPASDSRQVFTISGHNFQPGCSVVLRDLTAGQVFSNRTISAETASQIVINPDFTIAADTWDVQVTNPDGQFSGHFSFRVIPPVPPVHPRITGINPDPVVGSDSRQPFTINGSDFVQGSSVTLHDLNTVETFPGRQIVSLSATQITIDPDFTTASHTWSVEVISPGGVSSGAYTFNVISPVLPAPVIGGVNPDPVVGSDSRQPFTINGSNFQPGCSVTLRDLTSGETFPGRSISAQSGTQVTINPDFTTAPHQWSVEVLNPDGVSSGQFFFDVVLPQRPPAASTPVITGVNPSPVIGFNGRQPFTIFGNNFLSGCSVTLRDLTTGETFSNRSISSQSGSQITINPDFTTAADTWSVEVVNPDGSSSGQFQFEVL